MSNLWDVARAGEKKDVMTYANSILTKLDAHAQATSSSSNSLNLPNTDPRANQPSGKFRGGDLYM